MSATATAPTGQLREAVRIGLVDYGMGNRRSVEKALQHVGAAVTVSGDPVALRACAGLVVPGVGAFPKGMRRLRERGLDELLREQMQAGRPLLGICLGMQLAFERSSEQGGAEGLGLLAGEVRELALADRASRGVPPTRRRRPSRGVPATGHRRPSIGVPATGDRRPSIGGLKLPHIGWNEVVLRGERTPLLDGLPGRCAFYHVHSFAPVPDNDEDVLGVCTYGEPFASVVGHGSFYGVQFHPEKSSAAGLRLLANFASICARSAVLPAS